MRPSTRLRSNERRLKRAARSASRNWLNKSTITNCAAAVPARLCGRDVEVVGVPAETIARFSKRHAQIDAETARQSESRTSQRALKDLREEIARATRKRKSEAQ